MAFHFPVMPRMFMSLRREEATPLYEIIASTPQIPDNCQWGLFLRNHDELTLEMVTDEERDYMYSEYAKDPRMRLNLGIRRRLAPLLDAGRDEIELMHAILFSLPGSPVLYYGDEIGMGDNVYLGDRDGVRTPMQWTGDRNGGFSRADFAQLYLPPLMDPVYGYAARNVEAQLRTPTSLLRWMQRFIALRKEHPVFGLGSYEALEPDNPRIFAHLRTYEEDIVVCVHNLARSAQAVQLDLSRFAGMIPEEMIGRSRFPRDRRAAVPAHARAARVLLVPAAPAGGGRVVSIAPAFEEQRLVDYVTGQRWFGAKTREVTGAHTIDAALLPTAGAALGIALVEIRFDTGTHENYQLLFEERDGSLELDPLGDAALASRARPPDARRHDGAGRQRRDRVPLAAGLRRAAESSWARRGESTPSSRTRRSSSATS